MIENVIEILVNFIDMFLTIGFLTIYLEPKYKHGKAWFCFVIAWLIGVIELSVINSIVFFESLATYLYILLYFIYALICLKGNVLLKLWMAIITQIIPTMISVVTNILVCCIIGYNPNDVIQIFNSVRLICLLIAIATLLISFVVIIHKKAKHPINNSLWYKLIIVPLVSVFSITNLMTVALRHPESMYSILFGMLTIVLANVLTYYFYTVICKEFENKLKINLLERQNEDVIKSIESSQAFVNQMRAVKHDINNQLLIINSYLESKQYTQATNYIKNITNDYLPNTQLFINSGNLAFDAIINAKLAVCLQKRIVMNVSIMKGSSIQINDVDITILFGNLIDNAIEASSISVGKRITIDIQNKGAYLSIIVRNSISGSVLSQNTKLETTKSDKTIHGLGIKNIKNIVKKYNGMIEFFEENDEFGCQILFENQGN